MKGIVLEREVDARQTAIPLRDDSILCAVFDDGFLGGVVVGVEPYL